MRLWKRAAISLALVLSLATPALAGDAWVAWVWTLHPSDRHGHWFLWHAYSDQATCQQVLRDKRDDLRAEGHAITNDSIDRDSEFAATVDGAIGMYRCLPAGVKP